MYARKSLLSLYLDSSLKLYVVMHTYYTYAHAYVAPNSPNIIDDWSPCEPLFIELEVWFAWLQQAVLQLGAVPALLELFQTVFCIRIG